MDCSFSANFSGIPVCTERTHDVDDGQLHHSTKETRNEVIERLVRGEGPTEIAEDMKEDDAERRITVDAVKMINLKRKRREIVPDGWPRDQMQCLVLLRQTLKEEVSPHLPVSGSI